MTTQRATIDHPLWTKLRRLDKLAEQRFPTSRYDLGFGALGLILMPRIQHGGYWCTPTNTLAFAHTGGNGVHFSFLIRNGRVTERSPIVITIPMSFGHPNFIGGESLFDFLCLGYHRGYFALETLPAAKCFDAYGSANWRPKRDSDHAVGYGVEEHKKQLLDFLIAKLGLSPWKDLKRKFRRLQKLHIPQLKMPARRVDLG